MLADTVLLSPFTTKMEMTRPVPFPQDTEMWLSSLLLGHSLSYLQLQSNVESVPSNHLRYSPNCNFTMLIRKKSREHLK